MLDDPRQVDDAALLELEARFRQAMRNAHTAFGPHAFRKWRWEQQGRSPINRPLFECWSVALADVAEDDVATRAKAIAAAARDLMTSDESFHDAISTSTGGLTKVEYRLQKAREAARAT